MILSINTVAADFSLGASLSSKNIDEGFNEETNLLTVKYFYNDSNFVDFLTYENQLKDTMVGARWGRQYFFGDSNFFTESEIGVDYGYVDKSWVDKNNSGSSARPRPSTAENEVIYKGFVYKGFGLAASMSLGYMFRNTLDVQIGITNRQFIMTTNYKFH